MEKKHSALAVILLLFVSYLASPCFSIIQDVHAKKSDHILYSHQSDENHPPETPHQPQGPLKGNAGEEYSYWTYTIDPEGDQLYYLFDWGDLTQSSWIGPFGSGENISASHVWQKRGEYSIRVKAKDSYNAESNWSDSCTVMLSGPYITFGNISGGIGLTIEIKNIGENDAEHIDIDIRTTKGIIVKALPNHYQIPLLPAGGSTERKIQLWGLGLGVFTGLPQVTLTAYAPNTKTRAKHIDVRLLGPFVRNVGESWDADESYTGYTLYSPMISTETFLINNSGAVVHSWRSTHKPALSVYLLENGNILRTAFPGYNPRFWGGGIGGRVEIFDWNGTRVWSFDYSTSDYCLHHDVEMLPNGNILMIAWEYKSTAEAISQGRNPNTIPQNQLWADHIIEVQPTGSTSGTIVWEWHLWDHLIQDYDPTKENYGVVRDHPELVDINYGGNLLSDWTHINSIDYNEEYDQILLSVLNFDEIWVIDHSTTTEEAAGHTGGRYGKGGDLLYRWGNPLTYRTGSENDRKLFNQHDATWIKAGFPGAGNILIFNNGAGRPDQYYSSVDEIVPPMAEDGTYVRSPGSAYGPTETIWSYTAEKPADFFALNLGGAQRLPNGNTLICNGPHGQFFEVTSEKEVVWKYSNQIPDPLNSHVFKILRYGPEYPGLKFY
jgi:hypothetical protein